MWATFSVAAFSFSLSIVLTSGKRSCYLGNVVPRLGEDWGRVVRWWLAVPEGAPPLLFVFCWHGNP